MKGAHCAQLETRLKWTQPLPCSSVPPHTDYRELGVQDDQFTQGLNSCDGLWDVMRSHCEAFAHVMTSAGSRSLTLPNFSALFTVSFSSDFEKLKKEEKKTTAHWEKALGLIRGGKKMVSWMMPVRQDVARSLQTASVSLPSNNFAHCFHYLLECLQVSLCAVGKPHNHHRSGDVSTLQFPQVVEALLGLAHSRGSVKTPGQVL
ncbi:hypothetical protein WMY93_024597 [Mugilogobius chulae]|uniref:Uncharacterized protein n=1 Tax=Mugilogobius chulae TaxID=88201 RepID=A0AAW0N4L5_9GOBI